jgi:hypothetical protein
MHDWRLFLARPLHTLKRAALRAKSFLPKSLQRLVLLYVLHVNREYKVLLARPHRRFIEQDVLPWLRNNYRRILFVGTASYTYHYERLFYADRDQYTTMDFNPALKVWGAREHITAPIQEIGQHRPKGFFDCVVLNGVFGFGIDDVNAMRETIETIHDILAPNGLLVLGWNRDILLDPAATALLEPYFRPAADLPWAQRVTYSEASHVLDFYRRSQA